MTIESEIVDTSGAAPLDVLARCRVVLVFFDATTQTSVTPPPGYREAIMDALTAR